MNIVILAGGVGTRLAEETEVRPKPMVEVGGRPLLWHIMAHYGHYGHRDFFVALGYKGEHVKRYFLDHHTLEGDMTVNLASGVVTQHQTERDPWVVHLIDTGPDTQTGGRLRRLRPRLDGQTFMATYGDGLANVDLRALADFHRQEGRLATLTAVRPPARYGSVDLDGTRVAHFEEKSQAAGGWINGGFMVFEPDAFNYIESDGEDLGYDVLARLARDGQLSAYRHTDFWLGVDTLRDKRQLETLWQSGERPWQVWP